LRTLDGGMGNFVGKDLLIIGKIGLMVERWEVFILDP